MLYSSHITYDNGSDPLTVAELSSIVRYNYQNEAIVPMTRHSNQGVNLNMLSNDLNLVINKINEMANPNTEIEALKNQIAFLEEKISKLEFLVGEN